MTDARLLDAQIAEERRRLAQLELQRALIDEREANERRDRELGRLTG